MGRPGTKDKFVTLRWFRPRQKRPGGHTTPTTSNFLSIAPSISPSLAPSSFKDPCVNLKKKKCKKQCVLGPKKVKVCLPKKKEYENDCSQHTVRTWCMIAEYCKFANGKCFHRCDGLRKTKKCIKDKFCKPAKAANPCRGCQLVTTCGPSE